MKRLGLRTSMLGLLLLSGADLGARRAHAESDPDPARIWYLHNSGWAVETQNHLLVFDYLPAVDDTVEKLIVRLRESAEREQRRLVVFVSHLHADHYSSAIHGWVKQAPDILYVFGWEVDRKSRRVILSPRQDTLVAGMRIRTIRSTDLGVGFLVQVDSLAIFHAGDHALWDVGDGKAYEEEIRWLADRGEKVDIAFLPIATGACEGRESIRTGAANALIALRPAVAFPMHVRCTERLWLYRQFAEGMRGFAGRGALLHADRLGQGFAYDRRRRGARRLP